MIGIDIESIKRIENLINKKPNIVKGFFSDYEWEYAKTKVKRSQTLTGVWCAKEAVVKAFYNICPILVQDVELKHHSSGLPYVFSISNKKLLSKYQINISISHAKDYATAVAIINKL